MVLFSRGATHCRDSPGEPGSGFLSGRPWDNTPPSQLCETRESLPARKRLDQKCTVKKPSPAAARRKRSGREASEEPRAAGQAWTVVVKPARRHMRTDSPWSVTRSVLGNKHWARFEEATCLHTELSSKSGSLVSSPNSNKNYLCDFKPVLHPPSTLVFLSVTFCICPSLFGSNCKNTG